MITSNKQLQVAKEKVRMLHESLAAEPVEGIPLELVEASKEQTKDLIKEIEGEIFEYESLRKQMEIEFPVRSIEDLLKLPTQYRIVNELSVDQFARLVGKSPRQIIRYEEEDYHNITIGTFTEIMSKLPVQITGKIEEKKATA